MKQAKVLNKGLQYDRRYMLVDENNQFITQRNVHELALFKLSFSGDGFEVAYKNDLIKLPLNPMFDGVSESFTIWDDQVQAHELGEDFSKWFSRHLNLPCRLVYFPEESERLVDREYVSGAEQVSLADGYPYLVLGHSSLDDLNSRLKEHVPMNRFRPNLVFNGGEPFVEDKWINFSIGANRFRGVKPCARCVLTTIDQETGISGTEPLATLSTFRKFGGKVNFGLNVIPIDFYQVNEGDHISIESYIS